MKIGIDLGGSHIGIGVINDNGKILDKSDIELKSTKDIENLITNLIIREVTNYTSKYKNVKSIGIASPGEPKKGKITNLVNLGIKELDIVKILNSKFDIPIKIKNDAKCAAMAEKKYGALRQYQDAVFLGLGTGIGASVFLGEKELKPMRNSGLEIGHMIIERNGIQCNCGKKGCFETYCSIKRLKNNLMEIMNIPEISGEELVELLKTNKDNNVQKILNEYINNLIIGISNIIDIFEPQAICLGGSFVHFEEILYKPLLKEYNHKKYVFNKEKLPELKLATLGNDAGIIGATLI